MDALARDQAPLAIKRFNASAFAEEIRQAFGDGDDAVFSIEVCDFTGQRANWIILSAGWSTPDETLTKLLQMCNERGLHIYAEG